MYVLVLTIVYVCVVENAIGQVGRSRARRLVMIIRTTTITRSWQKLTSEWSIIYYKYSMDIFFLYCVCIINIIIISKILYFYFLCFLGEMLCSSDNNNVRHQTSIRHVRTHNHVISKCVVVVGHKSDVHKSSVKARERERESK